MPAESISGAHTRVNRKHSFAGKFAGVIDMKCLVRYCPAAVTPASASGRSAFGAFDVRIDPWAVEYGGETPTEFQPDAEDTSTVDVAVEVDGTAWAPISPVVITGNQAVSFVDGVRRMEARLVVTRDGRVIHGALGSFGVGVVECRNGRAVFGEERRGRLTVFGSGEVPPSLLELAPGLVYAPHSVPEEDADAPLKGLHNEMRAVERQLARDHAAPDRVVIADGPLAPGETTAGHVVGFVKRLFKLYIPAEQLAVLRALPIAARTPLFLIAGNVRFSRYSWFLRLGPRLPIESDFTGLVRLEVSGTVGRDEAVRLADLTTALLPRFVPSRTRDPRAPQNLVPIGALEQHLRRGLGDARLIHRRLATRLAQEAPHA